MGHVLPLMGYMPLMRYISLLGWRDVLFPFPFYFHKALKPGLQSQMASINSTTSKMPIPPHLKSQTASSLKIFAASC